MKIIIAPDSFKGTILSKDAGKVIADAFCRAAVEKGLPEPDIITVAMADGGEGTTEALVGGRKGAEIIGVPVSGPDPGQTVNGFYGILFDGAAVVELAAAAALDQSEIRNPEKTTTYGVGQLISAALDEGPSKIILALGGSATNDGGCGIAAALGVRFLDKYGVGFVPTGGTLKDICDIDMSGIDKRLCGTEIEVMCDVINPLCGENGAAAVFAPQKGADAEMVKRLDAGLYHLALLWSDKFPEHGDILSLQGGGAAGGCGAGAVIFLGARLRSGADVVLDAADFDSLASGADIVITGEGRFDLTSLCGKAVGAVGRRCEKAGINCIVFAGAAEPIPYDIMSGAGISAVFSIQRAVVPREEIAVRAKSDLYETALNAARLWMR